MTDLPLSFAESEVIREIRELIASGGHGRVVVEIIDERIDRIDGTRRNKLGAKGKEVRTK